MTSVLSRREFMERSGLLVVGFAMARSLRFVPGELSSSAAAPAANQLDSWLTVAADGTVLYHVAGDVSDFDLAMAVTVAIR